MTQNAAVKLDEYQASDENSAIQCFHIVSTIGVSNESVNPKAIVCLPVRIPKAFADKAYNGHDS